jgi:hypothetical protein
LLQEPSSPISKSLLFCKTTTLTTALPSHDTNQWSIRIISLNIKMITPPHKFTSLQLSNTKEISFFPNILVILAPLATHLPTSYTKWRTLTLFRGAFNTFQSGAKQSQSTSPTEFI